MGCTGARVTDMKLTLKHTIAAILLMWSFAAPVAAGPLEDGYTAYTRGDFATAMRLMRPLADQGNITAQIVVGFVPNTNSDNFGWLPCFLLHRPLVTAASSPAVQPVCRTRR